MATITRRKRLSRGGLTSDKRHELLTGEITYCSDNWYRGYGDQSVSNDLHDFINDEMKADWVAHREELMDFWRSGKVSWDAFPDEHLHFVYSGDLAALPWAAEQFDTR